MQELLEAIKRVRERIECFRDQLHQNEMLTRYALVDPILRALGWNTEDPEQVVPEFQTGVGRPDYALKHDKKPLVMVEVKPLRSDLARARDEGFRYCWQNRVPFYAITDGNVWELHDLREMGGKEIFRVRLEDENFGDAARKLLALWRPAMPIVETAPPPVIEAPPLPLPKPHGLSLPELLKQMRPWQNPPESIRFPDGHQVSLGSWKDLLVTVAKWALTKLEQKGKLPLGKLINRNGKMRSPKDIGNGWQVETWLSAKGCVRSAVRILREAGEPLDQVVVMGWEGQGKQIRRRRK